MAHVLWNVYLVKNIVVNSIQCFLSFLINHLYYGVALGKVHELTAMFQSVKMLQSLRRSCV